MSQTVNDLNRVLTSKGYAIKKSSLTAEQTQFIRSELIMSPKVLDKFQNSSSKFPIYYESKTRFYVPRHWGTVHFGEPESNIVSEGQPLSDSIHFRTTFPPRDFQRDIMSSFIERGANGLICVPCGYGKTFMALHLAVQLKRRFLIVVDKEFLMNQWKAEIENFIEGVTVGILQGATCQVGDTTIAGKERTVLELKQLARNAGLKVGGTRDELVKRLEEAGIYTTPEKREVKYDVTICMIQTICRQEFPDGFFEDYGFTIFDECHHLGAAYFSQALQKIQTKYMLGLSATPDREDGLSCVFEHYLGEAVYKKTQREPDKEAIVKAVWFSSTDPAYEQVPLNWRGEPMTATLLNQVADFEPRNQMILTHLKSYAADPNRFILLLSDRISQLEWFEKILESEKMYTWGYYVGGMKQSKLDENAEKCQILLATYQMASEAFSVKKLNTVFLLTPRKRVEQSTGRIFRQRVEERIVAPHIIDILDSHDCHKRRWLIRKKFYKDCEYTIQHINQPEKVVGNVKPNEHGSLFQLAKS
jgi:superfamily II DNA or RNA helicase